MENARQFDLCDASIVHARGLAYRGLGREAQAAAEFGKVRRGGGPVMYPLVRLELARALAASGNAVKSRETYEEVFELWKNADADFQPLQAARREYARIR